MGICSDNEARRRGEGAFSKKVWSKLRFDRDEKKVPTGGEPLKPRFDTGARLPKTKPMPMPRPVPVVTGISRNAFFSCFSS